MRAICKLLPAIGVDGNEYRLLTSTLQRTCEDIPIMEGENMVSAPGRYDVATSRRAEIAYRKDDGITISMTRQDAMVYGRV